MKKAIILLTLVIMCNITEVSAFIYSSGVKTQGIHKFEEPIVVNNIAYDNFGICFKQFSILFIPIWNYGGEPKYVLYNKNTKYLTTDDIGEPNLSSTYVSYYQLSPEQVEIVKKSYNVGDISITPELSFWNKWFGKILIVILVGLYFYFEHTD